MLLRYPLLSLPAFFAFAPEDVLQASNGSNLPLLSAGKVVALLVVVTGGPALGAKRPPPKETA